MSTLFFAFLKYKAFWGLSEITGFDWLLLSGYKLHNGIDNRAPFSTLRNVQAGVLYFAFK